jgi:HAMP domain-containing protein
VFRSIREQPSVARQQPASRIMDAPRQVEQSEKPDFPPAKAATANAAPAPVASPSRAPGSHTAMRLRDQVPRSAHGPVARLMFGAAVIVAAFGMLASALVYFRLSSALSEHALQRAKVTAVNVSDGASPYLIKKNAARLRDLLRKHANRPELAYIVVEDRAQRIFAHSFPVLPAELSERSIGPDGTDNRRTLRLGGNAVYEVSVPIMEGRAGAVRVGIWRERVDEEISETMKPLIAWLACVSAGGILAALFFAWRINRPIFRLVSAAQAISRGDLDIPSPNVADPGEFGELSRALERLRSSMKAALIRLGQ